MSVKQYRKKPVVIDALQFKGTNSEECIDFVGESADISTGKGFLIRTLEGDMCVGTDDFIIKGVQNEFYPCKPDIFEATYDEVTSNE